MLSDLEWQGTLARYRSTYGDSEAVDELRASLCADRADLQRRLAEAEDRAVVERANAQLLLADLRAVSARHGLGEEHALHDYAPLLGGALDLAKQHLQQAEADAAELLRAVEARDKMLVAYRLGRAPAERVFRILEQTRDICQEPHPGVALLDLLRDAMPIIRQVWCSKHSPPEGDWLTRYKALGLDAQVEGESDAER